MPGPEEMRQIVWRHIRLWKSATHAEWRACFTPDYQIEDPVGTGLRPMGSYQKEWDNMHADGLRLDMEPYRLTVGGMEVVADLRAVTHLEEKGVGPDRLHGARSTLSYTGIYTVDEHGLLCANRTFADPVSDELWEAFYPELPPPSERDPLPLDAPQIRQALEDHLYFWNVGTLAQWRRRFSEDAMVENPVGSGLRPLGDGSELWASSRTDNARTRLGIHRSIVCGMEALAHGVTYTEIEGQPPLVSANTDVFAFDESGYIRSWRVFREEGQP